jgi:Trp operon repressor
MSSTRRSKHDRRENRHKRAENVKKHCTTAKRKAKNAAKATGKVSVWAVAMALIPGLGATAGSYYINHRAKANELEVKARGIARVAQRDLHDAANALAAYKTTHNKQLVQDSWTPIAASDLQSLASNLSSTEWRRFGCAAKTADGLVNQMRSGSRPAKQSLNAAIRTIMRGAAALSGVSDDPSMVKKFKRTMQEIKAEAKEVVDAV